MIRQRQVIHCGEERTRGAGEGGAGVAVAGAGVEMVEVGLGGDQDLAAADQEGACGRGEPRAAA